MPATPVGQNAYREAAHVARVGAIREAVTNRPADKPMTIHCCATPASGADEAVVSSDSDMHQVNISGLRHFLR